MVRVTQDDLLDAIETLGRQQPKRPSGRLGKGGWETMAQMAKRQGIGISAMRNRFTQALTQGLKVERFVGSDYDGTGRLTKQTWLRVKR